MKFLILLIFTIVFVPTFAQDIYRQKSLGGSREDYASFMNQTLDGGYIVAGASASIDKDVIGHHGDSSYNYDFLIIKQNSLNKTEWQKSLGGSGDDIATYIEQTKDGGYIVAGYSESIDGDVTANNGNYDYWIVKLNSLGNIEWQKNYGGKGYDYAKCIHQTVDGGYIVAGQSNSGGKNVVGNNGLDDYWVLKLNSTGVVEWQKSLGGSSYDQATSIQQTKEGGYVVAGYTKSKNGFVSFNNGGYDFWVVKLNTTGEVEWEKSIGGDLDDLAYSVVQTSDSGFAIAGYTYLETVSGNHGGAEYWVVKLNSSGIIEWRKKFGGTRNDFAYSIQETSDTGFIVGGYSNSSDGDLTVNYGRNDYWILKLSSSGMFQWQKSYGGSNDDIAYSLNQTKDGGFILAGSSNSTDGIVKGNKGDYDLWILKLNPLEIFINTNTGTTICSGTKVTCTATLTRGGTASAYIWKKNGIVVGKESTYTDSLINDLDSIICIYKSQGKKYFSNKLIFRVNQRAQPTISIVAKPDNEICTGTAVTFNATSTYGGTEPKYNWYKNNLKTGIQSNIYTDNQLKNKDSVWCILISNDNCITSVKDTSRTIYMLVDNNIPDRPSEITGPSSVKSGQSNLIYSVIQVANQTYNWTVPSGCTITSGIGTNSIRVKWGTKGGWIKVSANNPCGTSLQTSGLNVKLVTAINKDTQTTNSILYSDNFKVYPNPAKNNIVIDFSAMDTQKYSVQITDETGKLLLRKNGVAVSGNNKIDFDLSNYAKGIYFISLVTDNNKQVVKIFKD